jgi:hypothetical protein
MTKKLPRVEFRVVPEDALLVQGDASEVLQPDNLAELVAELAWFISDPPLERAGFESFIPLEESG